MTHTVWRTSQKLLALGIKDTVAFDFRSSLVTITRRSYAMKRFVFLTFAISTLIAPIQVQAEEYDAVRNCIKFLRIPNPEAETRYLLSHPAAAVCPASNPSREETFRLASLAEAEVPEERPQAAQPTTGRKKMIFFHGIQGRYEGMGGSKEQTEADARRLAEARGMDLVVIGGTGGAGAPAAEQARRARGYIRENPGTVGGITGFSAGGPVASQIGAEFSIPSTAVSTGKSGQGGVYTPNVSHMGQLAALADREEKAAEKTPPSTSPPPERAAQGPPTIGHRKPQQLGRRPRRGSPASANSSRALSIDASASATRCKTCSTMPPSNPASAKWSWSPAGNGRSGRTGGNCAAWYDPRLRQYYRHISSAARVSPSNAQVFARSPIPRPGDAGRLTRITRRHSSSTNV